MNSVLFGIVVLAVATVTLAGPTRKRQKRSQACYGDLGCFSDEAPFNNTEGILPQGPAHINTTFRLFTPSCRRPIVISQGQPESLTHCGFHSNGPMLKVIIHGFLQHGQVAWVTTMARRLLRKERMNVISVDWGSGSGFPYSQASANTRVVGAEVARMIDYLASNFGQAASNVHLIGHSLGAHVAGYAGSRVSVARITGLDPAEPDFKDTAPIVHLDKSDADFVDIIHSDGSEFDYVSGFGWIKAVGHIDFYPNGGMHQPGCPDESVSNFMSQAYQQGINDAEDVLSCSHSRSIYLFSESINSRCHFYGHPCPSLTALDTNQGDCFRCEGGACPVMGYNADKSTARGKFYLRTRGGSPYCGYTQHIQVEFGNMDPINGLVHVQIVGRDQTSDIVTIQSSNGRFVSGEVRDALLVDRESMDEIEQVRVTFTKPGNRWWWSWWSSASASQHQVVIYKVVVTSADGRRIHFCGDHSAVANGNTVSLSRSTANPHECMFAPLVHGLI